MFGHCIDHLYVIVSYMLIFSFCSFYFPVKYLFATTAPGRARYGGTAPRQGKRLRVASPGLSPSGKEPRVEEEEGRSEEDGKDETSTSNSEKTISQQDKNVTVRKNEKKTKE